jgi:hypothetical protein
VTSSIAILGLVIVFGAIAAMIIFWKGNKT